MNIIDYNKYLYVYADIFFTKGYTRTMICDIKDKVWKFIPNDYYYTLRLFTSLTMKQVIMANPYNVNVEELIKYLVDNQLAIVVEDICCFPKIQKKWYTSHYIENAIIDLDRNSCHNYTKIATQLESLLCKHLQIRAFSKIGITEIEHMIKSFVNRDLYSIDFLLMFNETIGVDQYLKLAKDNPSVSFIIHSSEENKFYNSLLHGIYPVVGYVQYIRQKIDSSDCCGIIDRRSFVHPNSIRDYMEGVLRNRCLNHKISIDIKGNIKNCPSMKHVYGNINDTSLLDVYKNKKFQSFWYLRKDKIHVCQDCEYRYVCCDCRAFVKQKYDKPTKCHYNPYTGKDE